MARASTRSQKATPRASQSQPGSQTQRGARRRNDDSEDENDDDDGGKDSEGEGDGAVAMDEDDNDERGEGELVRQGQSGCWGDIDGFAIHRRSDGKPTNLFD
jgi:hypothetical protein